MSNLIYTYAYSQQYNPSAPVIEVEVTAPGVRRATEKIVALVDSGSDGTIIPVDLLERINARCVGDARMVGVVGGSFVVDIYLATLIIGIHTMSAVRVVAAIEGAEAIVGRNVLNRLVVTPNGLAGMTEISA